MVHPGQSSGWLHLKNIFWIITFPKFFTNNRIKSNESNHCEDTRLPGIEPLTFLLSVTSSACNTACLSVSGGCEERGRQHAAVRRLFGRQFGVCEDPAGARGQSQPRPHVAHHLTSTRGLHGRCCSCIMDVGVRFPCVWCQFVRFQGTSTVLSCWSPWALVWRLTTFTTARHCTWPAWANVWTVLKCCWTQVS